jgi:hypothetical protein
MRRTYNAAFLLQRPHHQEHIKAPAVVAALRTRLLELGYIASDSDIQWAWEAANGYMTDWSSLWAARVDHRMAMMCRDYLHSDALLDLDVVNSAREETTKEIEFPEDRKITIDP